MHGDPDNLQSLRDKREEGNFRKATKAYEELLVTIEEDPENYGYDFGRWTAARLAIHLEKETGIKLSGSQISRILQKKAVRPCGFSSRLRRKSWSKKGKRRKVTGERSQGQVNVMGCLR